MKDYEILILDPEHVRYGEIVVAASKDPVLCREMREDAELEWELDDRPTFAAVVEVGTNRIMAMAGWRIVVENGVSTALCRANFHFRAYRDYPWYALAFIAREMEIRGLPAITWIYEQPGPLHAAAGWVKVPGQHGWSKPGEHVDQHREPDGDEDLNTHEDPWKGVDSHEWWGWSRPAAGSGTR